MLKDFKKFVLRGNVIDLAVAVALGAAFGAIVNSLVKDVFTPLVAAVMGKPDFSKLTVTIHGSTLYYGNFINAVITFILIAIVLFFLIVQPVNKLHSMSGIAKLGVDPDSKICDECLSQIPKKAKRCKYCSSVQK